MKDLDQYHADGVNIYLSIQVTALIQLKNTFTLSDDVYYWKIISCISNDRYLHLKFFYFG